MSWWILTSLRSTWNNADGDVHLLDGAGEGGGDGSQADEETSHHHHWTMTKAVAQQGGQWGWGEGGRQHSHYSDVLNSSGLLLLCRLDADINICMHWWLYMFMDGAQLL